MQNICMYSCVRRAKYAWRQQLCNGTEIFDSCLPLINFGCTAGSLMAHFPPPWWRYCCLVLNLAVFHMVAMLCAIATTQSTALHHSFLGKCIPYRIQDWREREREREPGIQHYRGHRGRLGKMKFRILCTPTPHKTHQTIFTYYTSVAGVHAQWNMHMTILAY